ncbi:alkaline phosphatase family protein [Lamprobacter modestohalophilus]|uniref:alkaline phosphatase family protein n=1 Tax=Lamprobacter modestohalophilus TaxID=1064514 RepID=UPI002ADED047|nr:alkaline phosphatase family protein [Lamprobacter modestohalophilus]MEA1049930.1 alkaline phosphatase family protein [Lamprobacter modestohalophilus]
MHVPNYQGGSIVNLMQSLIAARGHRPSDAEPYPEAQLLPAAEIRKARHVLLLVIDGLGDDWLRRHSPDGPLARHRLGSLTSVFPPTTASAITTYLTGDAPQQHAMTGWYMWLGELGSVLAVLPGKPRYGGSGYKQAGIDVQQLYRHRSLFACLDTASGVISPRAIARSDYNLAHLGPARLYPYKGLSGMFSIIAKTLKRARDPTTLYAYWPGLDSIGHEQGIESPRALAHLDAIEQGLSLLMKRLAGTDTLVLICADHGQLDSAPAQLTEVNAIPDLADCLRIPLCGEPRAAYCYVRLDQGARFEHLCVDHLGQDFELFRSTDLIDQGLFGLGQPHPHLQERVGDYCLIARDRAVLHQALIGEKPFQQIGVHGGLSSAELMVPLCRFDA